MTISTRRRLSFHEQRTLRSRAPPARPFTKKEGLPAAVATSKILPSKVLPSNYYPSNPPRRRRRPAVDHEPNQPPPPPPPTPKKPKGSITEPTKEYGTSSSSLGLLQMDGWNSLSLGVLLNQTLVKAFPIGNVNVGAAAAATSTTTRPRKRSRKQQTTRPKNHHHPPVVEPEPPCQYYRGTIVSYWVPPIYEYEPRLVGSITHTPHDYGLYHVCFDDGDQCDMDPNEAYECMELYHTQQQQQPQPRNHSHPPPQETTTTNTNNNTNNTYRSRRTTMMLNVERLLFYHHFEEYFKSQGLASVKAWAIQIGWNFDFEQTLLLSAIQTLVTHETTITTTNAAANQTPSCQENNDNPDDGSLVVKNRSDTTTHMGSSLTGNALAVYPKGSSSSTTVLQKRKFAIPASSTNWVHPTSSHVLYATKTRCSARRTTHANSQTGHSLSLDTLLPTRVLTLPYHEDPAATVSSPLVTNHNQHTITLTVAPSYIPNAGRGLFLTYEGPCEQWITPGHVDIGKYAPHQPSDIKGQIVMEVKNFVFRNEPSEWSFDGPPPRRTTTSSSTIDKHPTEPHVLYGNPVDPHALFDITSDETGQVHDGARRTLLPFVNEIMTTKKKRRTHLHTREVHPQRLDVQNVDAVHHDDGTLHYLLRAGAVFRRSEQTELLLYYGSEYNDVRHRKYVSHNTTRAKEEGNSVESVLCDGNEDISTLTTSEDPSEVITTITKRNALGPNASKDGAEPQKATTTRCATKQGMCYLTMYSTITTYTEQNLHQVLDFFLATPPIPSLARKRMVWVVEQAASYASQVLYQSNGTIPRDISDKISNVLKLFPRNSRARVDTESSHQDNDFELHKWHALLGCFVRKEIEGHGYCIGIVEEIIAPPAAAALGRTPIQKGAKVRTIRACDVRYRVTFPRFEQDIVMKESEAKKYLFNHKYPCFLLS